MTKRLNDVVPFIESYTTEKGYPPSTRDLAEALGYKSVESVHRLLALLRESGEVEWEAGKARTLRVTKWSAEANTTK